MVRKLILFGLLFGLGIRSTLGAQAMSGYIAFVSSATDDGNEDIFVIDTSGNNLYDLTVNPARDWHPDWSPDGQKIVFTSNRSGSADLFVMDANGDHQQALMNTLDINESAPSWSVDGDHIAYVGEKSGVTEIYALSLSQPDTPQQMTNDGIPKGAPAWSSDGQQISFWRGTGDQVEIVTVDRATLKETTLVADGANNWPAYSLDGSKIAFFRAQQKVSKLYALDFATDQIAPLSDSAPEVSDLQPAWSPDGTQLVFTSNRDGHFQIYTAMAFGAQTGFGTFANRLVYLDADSHSPAWQPKLVPINFGDSNASSMGQSQRVIQHADGEDNQKLDNGKLTIYAPEQTGPEDVIRVRLELQSNSLINNNAATPTLEIPTMPARFSDQIDLYRLMGADLQGFDIDAFKTNPSPTSYVIQVDPTQVNYWEWLLKPVDAHALGKKDLVAVVYLPVQEQDGETSQLELLREPFSINVVPAAVAAAATAVPAATPTPEFSGNADLVPTTSASNAHLRIVYSSPDLFSLIVLQETNLSDLAIASLRSEEPLVPMFDVLRLSGAVAKPDMCLHFVRYQTHAPIPTVCDSRQNFRREVGDTDVFWYDTNRAQLLDTVIRDVVSQTTLGFCSGTDQNGCEF